MRIYQNCVQMICEEARNLIEMGVRRRTKTMQNKNIQNDEGFVTKELINNSFCILDTSDREEMFSFYGDNSNKVLEWCKREFRERVSVGYLNPGEAYKIRNDVWNEFLVKGKFDYTYNERVRTQIRQVIDALKNDIFTRQAILSIWNPVIDVNVLGKNRVPCSIFYQFLVTSDISNTMRMNIIYNMRSSDFATHFINDVYLAIEMRDYIMITLNNSTDLDNIFPGSFYMNVSSLHYYMKDEKKMDDFMSSIKHG